MPTGALAAGAALTGRPMGAVVVDHGLQKGSADVAAWTAQTCEALGLAPVFVRAVAVDGPGGPEAAARTALQEGAHRLDERRVVVGSHASHDRRVGAHARDLGDGRRVAGGVRPNDGRPARALRGAVVGGCCGTTDAHLRALAGLLVSR